MFEHPRHLPCRGRHTRNRHDRMSIYFEHFVGAIIHHGVARGRATITRDQHAAGKFEREDRRRFSRNKRTTGSRGGWFRRNLEQTFATQYRRKILTCSRKIRIEHQRWLVHYWPVRWR